MKIQLIDYPRYNDMCLFMCALRVTSGKEFLPEKSPSPDLLHKVLMARHSPIRLLEFTYYIEGIPSNIATHFARHKHADIFIQSLRNDRQTVINGDDAPRNTPVNMMIRVNAEELMTIANKRLCHLASELTRQVTAKMCELAEAKMPELRGTLVPNCVYHGGNCYEIKSCGRYRHEANDKRGGEQTEHAVDPEGSRVGDTTE